MYCTLETNNKFLNAILQKENRHCYVKLFKCKTKKHKQKNIFKKSIE